MGSGPRLFVCAWADSEGGHGVWTPPEKLQNYRVFLQYWYGSPEKNHKVTKPVLNVGPSLVRQSLHQLRKKQQQKTLPKSDPLWQNFLDPRKMCKLV